MQADTERFRTSQRLPLIPHGLRANLTLLKGKMMKIGKYDINLLYNGYAHFELRERLGGDPFSALFPYSKGEDDEKAYEPMNIEIFNNVCLAISIMCTQYELLRRTEGYDHQDIPSLSYIKSHLKFTQVAEATVAIMTAMSEGMKQDNAPEEVDLGLVELQKKTEE